MLGAPQRDTESHQCRGRPKGLAEPLLGPPNNQDLLVPRKPPQHPALPTGPPSRRPGQALLPYHPGRVAQAPRPKAQAAGITPGADTVNFSNSKKKPE